MNSDTASRSAPAPWCLCHYNDSNDVRSTSINPATIIPLYLQNNLGTLISILLCAGSTPGTVPSYFGLDARLAWHAANGIELSLVGHNLLQPRHVEYGFPSRLREQIDRSLYAKIAWRF